MPNLASGLKITLIPQGNKQGFSIKDKPMALSKIKAKIISIIFTHPKKFKI